ncbi:VanZ family protein [Leptolyngbya sp. FACHB-321]|uniref:VanZ family protein n=1 Tax=Leptolyngbya sp. FACHB-321 TaxID=2692807 RepID=UPI00168421ED|nr:VanZ family protein [Leptolyngbya sp. FACHB-321]MBD2037709.1 VanZ family protein [Leptolyngbya sp. FACHB-321]
MYFNVAVLGLLWIFLYKLFPYSFPLTKSFSLEFVVHSFGEDELSQAKDFVELIISLFTFTLFGVGLADLLQKKKLVSTVNLVIILLISTSLSAVTEVLQTISAVRNANALDILTDSLGAAMGWFCFHQARFLKLARYASVIRLRAKSLFQYYCSLPILATGFVAYFIITSTGVALLPTAADLRNWDSSFPLLLGNELTGGRPWSGNIELVQIFDQALTEAEISRFFSGNQHSFAQESSLLAFYEFTRGGKEYSDRTGQLPDLSWVGEPPHKGNDDERKDSGVLLNATNWLQSSAPPTYLNERIKQSAQFTLNVMVQSDGLKQQGPARILSLSKDLQHRNLTLGQDDSSLVIRLRTPATGVNGRNPEIVVPQVFTEGGPHHLVMTYADSNLRLYVDKLEHLYTFNVPSWGYKVLYYGPVFVPLAILFNLILLVTRGLLPLRIILLVSGVVLPSLLLEGLLASTNHRNFSPENLLMCLAFTIGTLLIARGRVQPWLKAH